MPKDNISDRQRERKLYKILNCMFFHGVLFMVERTRNVVVVMGVATQKKNAFLMRWWLDGPLLQCCYVRTKKQQYPYLAYRIYTHTHQKPQSPNSQHESGTHTSHFHDLVQFLYFSLIVWVRLLAMCKGVFLFGPLRSRPHLSLEKEETKGERGRGGGGTPLTLGRF